MAGLREKKQAKTKGELLDKAWSLFSSQGFRETSVEQIAEAAEVSVGTVYNYFGSKNGLLIALVERDTAVLLKGGGDVLADPGEDAEAAVLRLLWGYAEAALERYDRSFIGEMMAASFQQPEAVGKSMTRFDYAVMEQITGLLSKLKEAGALNPELPCERAAMVLYGTLGLPLIMYTVVAEITVEDVREHIKEGIRAVFLDWRSR